MPRSLLAGTSALLLAAALLTGCTTGPADDPPSGATSTGAEPTGASDAQTEVLTDEHGVLTEAAVAGIGPDWAGSIFVSDIRALPGNVYSDDCLDSAWVVLSLFETALETSTTFQAGAGRPAPGLTLAVLEMTAADKERDLAALTHQLTECVGERADGEALQEPAAVLDGWFGLHVLGEDDRDVYWAPYATGILLAEVAPGFRTLDERLAEQARAILALQREQVR